MINPLQDHDIGRRVKFTGYMHPNAEQPQGVLEMFTGETAFVKFDGKRVAEPCGLDDLEWVYK